MKKKRTIMIRDPLLRKIRNALREIISNAANEEYRRLIKEKERVDVYSDKNQELEINLDRLDTARKNSICVCPVCGSRTSDMTFNPHLKAWFCVDCYEKNRQFYVKRGEPHIYP